jgi:hypothetical protein
VCGLGAAVEYSPLAQDALHVKSGTSVAIFAASSQAVQVEASGQVLQKAGQLSQVLVEVFKNSPFVHVGTSTQVPPYKIHPP